MVLLGLGVRRWDAAKAAARVNARPPPRRRVSALAWRAARHACHPRLRVSPLEEDEDDE